MTASHPTAGKTNYADRTTDWRSTRPDAHSLATLRVQLPDGGEVSLRQLAAGDDESLTAVFDGLSARSRKSRYLVGLPRLPGSMRRALLDVDGHRHVAWLATIHDQPAGIGRYIRTGGDAAEVSLEVVDAHQARGLGGVLLDAITTVASASGIRSLHATVLPENLPSIRLLSHLGMLFEHRDGLLEGSARLRLPDPPRTDRAQLIALARRGRRGRTQPWA